MHGELSFLGERHLLSPATALELREFKAAFDRKLDENAAATLAAFAAMTTTAQSPSAPTLCLPSITPSITPSPGISPCILPQYTTAGAHHTYTSPPQPLPTPLPAPASIVATLPTSSKRIVPMFPQAVIPKLKGGEGSWKRAMDQWETLDEKTGVALKDWPAEWYQGAMSRINGTKYGHRRVIAEEYGW
jgi:hypothetical protein